MANDLAPQKIPPTPILDRFRTMVQEREYQIKILSTYEIVRLYEVVLSELTFNSNPIITDLTIIAGEHREHGEGIADAICARIIEVPVEQKLSYLYLLDSIVKNIGREYASHFSARLPEVFCEAYRQVHPNLHPSMHHLFGTWSAVFPSSVLHKIESQLQLSPSLNHQYSDLTPIRNSESPRPTHGIHINPKYLEARRQFDHADSRSQLPRGTLSALKMHGQKPAIEYDKYDSGNAEVVSSEVGTQRLSSFALADRTSFAIEAGKLFPPSAAKIAKSSYGIGYPRSVPPSADEFVGDNFPRRVIERASPSHSGFDRGFGRLTSRDGEMSDWRKRNHWSDDIHQRCGNSAPYSYNNEDELKRRRALIDAYGNDQGEGKNKHKPSKADYLDINGIGNKVSTKTWQNSEEREFDWEDMIPTLADRRQCNDLFPSSSPPPGRFRNKPGGHQTHLAAPLETDFRRNNLSNQAQLSVANVDSVIAEDVVPPIRSGHGLINDIAGFSNETPQIPGTSSPQQTWKLNLLQSSQHNFNAKRGSINHQILFSESGISSSAGEQKPSLIDSFPNADPRLHGSSAGISRIGSSLDSLPPDVRAADAPASAGAWPPLNMHLSHPLPLQPSFFPQKQIRGQFDSMNASNAVANQGLNNLFPPEQRLVGSESNVLSKLPQFFNQQFRPISLNQQNPTQITPLPPPTFMTQEVQQNLVLCTAVSTPSHLVVPQLNHGYTLPGHGASMSTVFLNPIPSGQLSVPVINIPSNSLHLPGGALPPLPRGLPSSLSRMMPNSHYPRPIASNPPAESAFPGLISSLMAQGLITLTKQAPTQDSVGLDFNLDILKVRHESAITALYANLPRQCTTCGLRFKCQVEHSNHMDWHVTKNRISRNLKQKPSRKWFVSVNMWLSGAEALGSEAVPGFLPSDDNIVEKEDEEMAVPAAEDQNTCALCGEPFDDFYSDETEEWMYKGAVYLNAPTGPTAGRDRSQLGPIVHAKCRTESSAVSLVDFGEDEGGYTEEGSQMKRTRS